MKRKNAISALFILIKYAPFTISIILVIVCLIPLLSGINLSLTQNLINEITELYHFGDVIDLLFLIASIQVLIGILDVVKKFLEEKFSMYGQQRLQEYLLKSLNFTTITNLERAKFRNDMFYVSNNYMLINQLVSAALAIIQQTVLIITYSYIIVIVDMYIIIVTILCSIPIFIFHNQLVLKRENLNIKLSEKERESQYYFDNMMRPENQRELKIFDIKPFFLYKWSNAIKFTFIRKVNFMKEESAWHAASKITNLAGFLIVQIILIKGIAGGSVSLGEYVAVTAAFGVLEGSAISLAYQISIVKQFYFIKEKYEKLINEYIYSSNTQVNKEVSVANHTCAFSQIVLSNLSFKYPDFNEPALKNLNLTIEAGQSVSIVGENGSGKSTLGKVLLGMHEIMDNTLFYDGNDINNLNRETIYKSVSTVQQDFLKLPVSVYDNITFDHNLKDKNKWGQFTELYANILPFNIENHESQLLGNEYLGGKQLSGGQWQRIALARALYKKSSLLVLDEATSALDPENEVAIVNDILEKRKKEMTIFITHRLSITPLTDKILVMHNGRIIEEGNFSELMKLNGKFKKMWISQNKEKGDLNEANEFQGIVQF
ncbi:ATP-binding cassette domain-containing protein [Marinicrinis sediminis]|uniref:ATP-binding cassette domain-containing protein n=1 Tax=Marinicrinis sediminis TaxID=1652465 RepID=A0ABW5R717_9BACL